MSSKMLRRIQLGRESTMGTPVAATTCWRGEGTIQHERDVKQANEDLGLAVKTTRIFTPRIGASISMDAVAASYEQLPHILEASIGTDTPAADGAGSGYVYEYPFPTTALGTLKTYTIEGGDDQQAEEMEYSFVEDFTLSGAGDEEWTMAANWRGRQVTKTTFTAAGSAPIPTVSTLLFNKSKLYIDAVDGTSGTTQISSSFLAANLSVKSGRVAQPTGDGNLYFNHIAYEGMTAELDITFEHNASGVAQKDAWIAETPKLVQIEIPGAALGSVGDYTYKTVLIDLAGFWQSFDKIGEQNGNDVISGKFIMAYDPTAATAGKITVVNELSALP